MEFPRILEPVKEDLTEFAGKEGVPKHWYGEIKWGPLRVEDDKNTGDNYAAQYVIDQLNKIDKNQPFFLNCGIYRPHVPWFAPKKYFDMFPIESIQLPPRKPNDFDDIPGGYKRAENRIYWEVIGKRNLHREAVQAYLACVAHTDAIVGRLMRALEKSGHAENTIVVLWSDHGWHLGEKDSYRKFTLWEESCRIPFIIKLPEKLKNKFPQGINSGRVVSLIDIFPTLVELCNLPQPRQSFDGKSLLPLIENPLKEWNNHAISQYGKDNYSLRTEKFRYIRYKDGAEELYDHDNDPYEWNNLASLPTYQGIKKDLQNKLPKTSKEYVKTPPFSWPVYKKEVYDKAYEENIFDTVKPEWD